MLNRKQVANIKAELANEEAAFPLVFQALGDPCRFKIFKALMQYHDICVTDIANIFGITLSAASQQLRVLERLGLVLKMRMGQMVCYEINVENPIAKQLFKLFMPQVKKGRTNN
ncbi:MAG: winged helix-turn-helix transcriptional regulator [Candidatus Brennerbacteria bacterium]|nr:winged helix-turn-helix transcriptional regulator [Candidatus Brennerbacteria bacterium]